MNVKDMVVARLKQLCQQQGIALNKLATSSGMIPSTVYSMVDPSRKNISIVTIKKLCDGLDITLSEFFSTKEFDELEQEIK